MSGLGLDLHFAVWVSVVQSAFMQLLPACGVREIRARVWVRGRARARVQVRARVRVRVRSSQTSRTGERALTSFSARSLPSKLRLVGADWGWA